MSKQILFVLDVFFAFFGAFWAGLVFFRALSLKFGFVDWLLLFSVMAVLLYPLIRKLVEFLLEVDWSKYDYEARAKKRWEH